jgi:hypothetical protein
MGKGEGELARARRRTSDTGGELEGQELFFLLDVIKYISPCPNVLN